MPDMRFSPPPAVRVASEVSGMNQVVARSLNERLILSLILQNKGMTRLELGKASGLSAQTISVIARSLEASQIIVKGVAVKGRVGPPSRPMNLNPDGAFSVGLNVNNDEISAVVLNLIGEQVANETLPLAEWDTNQIQADILTVLDKLMKKCRAVARKRLLGVGLSLPRENARLAIPEKKLIEADLENFIHGHFGHEVHIQDEMTALISAEAMFGASRHSEDYLECYVDNCVHMRLCLGGRIYAGSSAQPLFPENLRPTSEVGKAEWVGVVAQELQKRIESLSMFTQMTKVVVSTPYSDSATELVVEELQSLVGVETEVVPSIFGKQALAVGAAALPFQFRFISNLD